MRQEEPKLAQQTEEAYWAIKSIFEAYYGNYNHAYDENLI
jgi:predicted fused transcriptional regulator/phosphomethylpyrimidine kinase